MSKREVNYTRNYAFDSLKMIAAILVVFQHAMGSGTIPGYLLALSRIAVLLFMMISGYLYIDVVERKGEKKQIRKFFTIACEMVILYFVLDFGRNLLRGTHLNYLKDITKPKDILYFFLFNDPTVADHSWYMWAMIYTLILALIFPSMIYHKKLRMALILIGTASTLIAGKYSILFFGRDIAPTMTRSAWSIGIPCFLCGMILREQREKINHINISWLVLITCVIVALYLLERYLLVSVHINGTRDSYIFQLPLSIAVFLLVYKIPFFQKKNFLAIMGMKYSLMIYIIHPLFVRVEYALLDMTSKEQYIGFVAVLVISTIAAVIIETGLYFIKNIIKN